MLAIDNLVKKYGEHVVLDQVNLMIPDGSLYGFAGINGVGKSTLIKCIFQFLNPESGTITIERTPITKTHDYKKKIGYLPEVFQPPLDLTCMEFLNYCFQLSRNEPYTEKEALALLEQVGLKGQENKLIKKLSKGMRQRLGVGQSLVHRPKLLILDEPFSGLDPVGRYELKILLQTIHQEGVTIFFSSHNLTEIHDLCTHLAILHQGKIAADGPVDALLEQYQLEDLEKVFLKVIGFTTRRRKDAPDGSSKVVI